MNFTLLIGTLRYSLSTLDFDDGASYKAKSSFGRLGLENLISTLDMNPRFVPDLLGRPNYWSPELYGSGESRGGLESIGLPWPSRRDPKHVLTLVIRFLLPAPKVGYTRS